MDNPAKIWRHPAVWIPFAVFPFVGAAGVWFGNETVDKSNPGGYWVFFWAPFGVLWLGGITLALRATVSESKNYAELGEHHLLICLSGSRWTIPLSNIDEIRQRDRGHSFYMSLITGALPRGPHLVLVLRKPMIMLRSRLPNWYRVRELPLVPREPRRFAQAIRERLVSLPVHSQV